MTAAKTLKIAVIGAGHLGRIHARLLAGVPNAKLVAIVDPVAESRRQVAAETGAADYADYRELAGKVDAAILAAPATLHHAIGVELLRQGIHLLIEKPLAVTLAEAEELVWAANWHGLVLQVGHIERFNPALEQVLPLTQGPRYIEATRASGYTFRSTDIGVVLDLMIHDLDVAMWLAGSRVRQVSAAGMSVMGPHEDVAQAYVEFENGCVAHLSASRVSPRPRREMQIWSPRANVSVDFSTRRATVVEPAEALWEHEAKNQPPTLERRQYLQQNFFSAVLPVRELEASPENALLLEQQDFVESVLTGRAPRVTGAQARDSLAVAEQILTSIANRQWREGEASVVGALPIFMPAAEPSILRGPHWERQIVASRRDRISTRKEAG